MEQNRSNKKPSANEINLESIGVNLPYSMAAEQSILGAIILKEEILSELIDLLRPEMFYSAQNKGVYTQMLALFSAESKIDFVTLLDAVVTEKVFDTPANAAVYLTSLAETVRSVSNVKAYVEIVNKKYLIRELAGVAKDILESANDEPDTNLLLENAERRIYELRAGRESNPLTVLGHSIVDTMMMLQNLAGENADKYRGIPTGFRLLDTMLTGLGRSDLIILAARPGMGKTSFALNIATNIVEQENVPVALFSLEMTKSQLAGRILSSQAGVDSQLFRTGKLSTQEWDDLTLATIKLRDAPLYLDDTSSITIAEMKAKIRRINQNPNTPNVGVVMIDYLQLMSGGGKSENRVQEISAITRSLKVMAKELNVPIIALSQLSRAVEKQGAGAGHRPQLSDLRDSGSIEQDADCVLFLYREGYYANQKGEDDAAEKQSLAECIVAKNRHGETGSVPLSWDGAHTRFTDVEFHRG